MSFTTQVINIFYSHRRGEIDFFMNHPAEVQQMQLRKLMIAAKDTSFGRLHGFGSILDWGQFSSKVAVSDYDNFVGYIDAIRDGEQGTTWPSHIKWFAKSSGTTGSKSKYIPVSDEGLRDCHLRGPMDVVCFFASLYPKSDLFLGKTLTLGGSHRLESSGIAHEGDLSAIMIENTPKWANWRRVPSAQTALIADFEQKIEAICRETVGQKVSSFAGVPSWNLVMMNKILEYTGKNSILDVWPEMELFVHGGMNFKPYREQYRKIIPSSDMKYMDTYNASEGFFAIQDDPQSEDMLLMLDYGVYYEFMPMKSWGDSSKIVPLEGVERGVNYAMIISTCNGLWRYMIGDTVEFTSTMPYKIKITGRTKHFINAFGEEIIIDNAESALEESCRVTGAHITDYSAGPIYMVDKTKGSHQWVIEFSTPPVDLDLFTQTLDHKLQELNSDYEAKRANNTTLLCPTVTSVPKGTFFGWMKGRGKAGGQNKVPRLSNDRTYIEQLIEAAQNAIAE